MMKNTITTFNVCVLHRRKYSPVFVQPGMFSFGSTLSLGNVIGLRGFQKLHTSWERENRWLIAPINSYRSRSFVFGNWHWLWLLAALPIAKRASKKSEGKRFLVVVAFLVRSIRGRILGTDSSFFARNTGPIFVCISTGSEWHFHVWYCFRCGIAIYCIL